MAATGAVVGGASEEAAYGSDVEAVAYLAGAWTSFAADVAVGGAGGAVGLQTETGVDLAAVAVLLAALMMIWAAFGLLVLMCLETMALQLQFRELYLRFCLVHQMVPESLVARVPRN